VTETDTEHANSYYAATAVDMPSFPSLSGDTKCDVCVIGGGFTGLSAALHLAERGYDVVLLEGRRNGPDLAALHPPDRSEIASMKSWSFPEWAFAATASDWRCACSAKIADRVSGTHIWIGRRPWARRRSRCACTFSRFFLRVETDDIGEPPIGYM